MRNLSSSVSAAALAFGFAAVAPSAASAEHVPTPWDRPAQGAWQPPTSVCYTHQECRPGSECLEGQCVRRMPERGFLLGYFDYVLPMFGGRNHGRLSTQSNGVGVEYARGRRLRYHFDASLQYFGGVYGTRLEPMGLGLPIVAAQNAKMKLEVEPKLNTVSLILAATEGASVGLSYGLALPVHVYINKWVVSATVLQVDHRYFGWFEGAGSHKFMGFDFRTRLGVGVKL